METIKIQEYARKLFEAHGDKAEHEAAQKALHFKQQGDDKQAEEWVRIREAIHQMRGPRES